MDKMIFPFKNSLVQKISVNSVVNASLWACFVISLPLFILTTQINDWVRIIYLIVASLPVLLFLVSYIYFMITNPDYLRSEQYQLKAESIRMLGNKDSGLNADAKDVVSITNPRLPSPTIVNKGNKK